MSDLFYIIDSDLCAASNGGRSLDRLGCRRGTGEAQEQTCNHTSQDRTGANQHPEASATLVFLIQIKEDQHKQRNSNGKNGADDGQKSVSVSGGHQINEKEDGICDKYSGDSALQFLIAAAFVCHG